MATDPWVFLYGRDYVIKICPETYHGSWTPDTSTYFRQYTLLPDNKFDSAGKWIGRTTYVSKIREWLFAASMLGYPWIDESDALPVLRRNLPQPLDWGLNRSAGAYTNVATPAIYTTSGMGTGWYYQDKRSRLSPVTRFTHHASRIVEVKGIGSRGQNPDTDGMWSYNDATSVISNPTSTAPDEVYAEVRFTVMFEKIGYELMFSNGPYDAATPGQDQSFGGEFSRYVVYQEEPKVQYVQVRSGVKWDENWTHYGQPAGGTGGVTGTPFAEREGIPVIFGENMLTWKWIDVPIRGFNPARISSYFGTLNNDQFPPAGAIPTSVAEPRTSYAPYKAWGKECLLFCSAQAIPKNNIYGEPCLDLLLCFHYSPATDNMGYWNRLLNSNAVLQRYIAKDGRDFFASKDFTQLFKP